MPKVSVCIPTFNGEKFIREAIKSIQNQDYTDLEIVIVDNCSNDNTRFTIKKIMDKFENILFFENKQNIGLAENLNKCILHSKGEYIKFLCVDDILMPGCINKMAHILDSNNDVSLVCSSRHNIDRLGRLFAIRSYSYKSKLINGKKAINKCLFGGNFIGEPTATMFRKNFLTSKFRKDLPQLMDMEMWFKLLEKGNLYFLKEPLCSIRIHDAQMTENNIKNGILIKDNILLFNEFINKNYIKKNLLNIFKYKFLMTYRFWISKKYIEKNYFKRKLGIYGFKYLFPLMAIIFYLRKYRRILFIKLFYKIL